MTAYLSAADLLEIASVAGLGEVRDLGLLDAAARRPQAIIVGIEAYPGLDEKAAALIDSIVGHRPLASGNEQLGWLAAVVFYGLNGVDLVADDATAHRLLANSASGEADYSATAAALAAMRGA